MQECPEIKGGGRERGEKRSDENGKRKEKKRPREREGERKKDGKFLWLAALPADPYRRNVLIGYNVVTREGVITKI